MIISQFLFRFNYWENCYFYMRIALIIRGFKLQQTRLRLRDSKRMKKNLKELIYFYVSFPPKTGVIMACLNSLSFQPLNNVCLLIRPCSCPAFHLQRFLEACYAVFFSPSIAFSMSRVCHVLKALFPYNGSRKVNFLFLILTRKVSFSFRMN